MIKTCPRCRNAGHVGEWYCDCEVARVLRARIDSDPRIRELRAKIDRLLGDQEPAVLVKLEDGSQVHHQLPRRTFE